MKKDKKNILTRTLFIVFRLGESDSMVRKNAEKRKIFKKLNEIANFCSQRFSGSLIMNLQSNFRKINILMLNDFGVRITKFKIADPV